MKFSIFQRRRWLSPKGRSAVRYAVEALEPRTLLNAFIVNNVKDSGDGSLRKAIVDANANPGLDVIKFDIPGDGTHEIAPAAALPQITDPVQINATTQSDYAGTPLIELDGSHAGLSAGLVILASNSLVTGLDIHSFSLDGIVLAGVSGSSELDGIVLSGTAGNPTTSATVVKANFIGTDPTGTIAEGNRDGIHIVYSSGNTISNNLLSGNTESGIFVADKDSTGNQIFANLIGTDISGLSGLGNGLNGVALGAPPTPDDGYASNNVVGSANPALRNVISGNDQAGVWIKGGDSNIVQGNYIGVAADGKTPLGNGTAEDNADPRFGIDGILIDGATNTTIGGAGNNTGNVISANDRDGVEIVNAAVGNKILGNLIGTAADGITAMPNARDGIALFGASGNTIGGVVAGSRNVISGNKADGIYLGADASGNAATSNQVVGNSIGLDSTGATALGNLKYGIEIGNGTSNIIGGTVAGARNIVSGNFSSGVLINTASSAGNQVVGDYIGTDVTGLLARPNALDGVDIFDSSLNIIGGSTVASRNVISGNGKDGIAVAGGAAVANVIEGNYVGTDVAGIIPIANAEDGVLITSLSSGAAANNVIGGTVAGARNVISGNGIDGVQISGGATGNNVSGNLIGTLATGLGALPNGRMGVAIFDSSNNTIGTTALASPTSPTPPGNVISGNKAIGVAIDGAATGTATGNRIVGNYIGLDLTGTSGIPNQQDGVLIQSAAANVIGVAGAGNIISGNNSGGLVISGDGAANNTISADFIGTDITGTVAIPNATVGILINDVPSNTIGGSLATRNIISGNKGPGVQISGQDAASNKVEGNFIGTDIGGVVAVPNQGDGVLIDGAPNNIIGDAGLEQANVISGNTGDGIAVQGDDAKHNIIQHNDVGTDPAATIKEGNQKYGIEVRDGGNNNMIGGTDTKFANTVAYNGSALGAKGHGVVVPAGASNAIRENSIFENFGRGIDLVDSSGTDGFTINDFQSAGEPNDPVQDAPVVVGVTTGSVNTVITWTLNSTPNTTFTIDFFSNTSPNPSGFGDGQTFLSTDTFTTDAQGNVTFTEIVAASDKFLSATATSPANNTSEFSMVDTDGDGIADAWETRGIDFNEDGKVDLTLPGANPNRKDIYVEIDAMQSVVPSQAALDMVVKAFANAPVANPDGSTGITLHGAKVDQIMDDEYWTGDLNHNGKDALGEDRKGDGDPSQDLNHNHILDPGDPYDQNPWNWFDPIKQQGLDGVGGFGTAEEQQDPEALSAKALVYRYCIFALEFAQNVPVSAENPLGGTDLTTSGIAEIGGNDFIVALGAWPAAERTDQVVAGTFMHELGHTLGLDHGGGDPLKYKPNYNSVMNYLWQVPQPWMTQFGANEWSLNYSDKALDTLDEFDLDEAKGINGDPSKWVLIKGSGAIVSEVGPVDWSQSDANHDGNPSNDVITTGIDINGDGVGDPLNGFDDWSHLQYYFGENEQAADGATAPSPDDGEMTFGVWEQLHAAGDGAGAFEFALSPSTVSEGIGQTTVTVLRGGGTHGTVTVHYSTSDGTATAGYDYLDVSGVVTFADGEYVKTFTIPILEDSAAEPTETIHLTLSDPTGGATLDDANDTATLNITDDDVSGDFVVTNTNDDGPGSLRQAILQANSHPGQDLIEFNIAGGGVQTIIPLSPLPTITDAVTIDATTQPGYAGTPLIVIDGHLAGGSGITLSAPDTTIRGLVIDRFSQYAIGMLQIGSQTPDNFIIENDYLGTDASGKLLLPNGSGIDVGAGVGIIGGPAPSDANIIAGNDQGGVILFAPGQNTIQGNTIRANGIGILVTGSDVQGNHIVGNQISNNAQDGIEIDGGASDNVIGGGDIADANQISGNGGAGVFVNSGMANSILHNSIYDNGGLGIDLAPRGVTPNDPQLEKDADTGPNELQNAPVLILATTGASHHLSGSITSAANALFTLEFFNLDDADPSGYGQGDRYLTRLTVTTNASGVATFDVALPANLAAATFISATATDAQGNTSEFSNAVPVQTDSDGDGISDSMENSAAGGDGNGDGIPDRLQSNVVSFANSANGQTITLVAAAGAAFSGVSPLPNPSPDDVPNEPDTEFDVGFFAFTLSGVAIGDDADITAILPPGGDPHSSFNYGPLPWDPTAQWCGGGISANGNHVPLSIDDGGIGDADLSINGTIVALLGLGFPTRFTVTNTHDSGPGSLRQAILDVDNSNRQAIIDFDINGGGVQTITPLSPLPAITQSVTIDGTTQPGFAGKPIVVIDGSQAGATASGLSVAAAGVTIRGLVIDLFDAAGIYFDVPTPVFGVPLPSDYFDVEGNYIGTDVSGMVPRSNEFGIFVEAGSGTIGGDAVADRNVISGNLSDGIYVRNDYFINVYGDFIGVAADGTSAMGNAHDGIKLDYDLLQFQPGSGVQDVHAQSVNVGSLDGSDGNVIAYNGNDGIEDLASNGANHEQLPVSYITGNVFLSNSIYGNGLLGIAEDYNKDYLRVSMDADDGQNLNDSTGFEDGIANPLNFPVLSSALNVGGKLTISGHLDTRPDVTAIVQFFSNPTPTLTGFGQGKTYLGEVEVTSDENGHVDFTATLDTGVPNGQLVSSTSTILGQTTSDFSQRIAVGDVLGSVFIVNSTDDTDDGAYNPAHVTLRDAILAANAHPGQDTIRFDIPGSGVHTITPLTALPPITDSVIIGGATQPGYTCMPLIEISGSKTEQADLSGSAINEIGLFFITGSSIVRGLAVNGFASKSPINGSQEGAGIYMSGNNNVLEGDFIGTNPAGTAALANYIGAILYGGGNRVGGKSPGQRNLISGNELQGLDVGVFDTNTDTAIGDRNLIEGNFIGTDVTGTLPVPNGEVSEDTDSGNYGLQVDGAATVGGIAPGAANVISGNLGDGLELFNDKDTIVQGNFIGTDWTGTKKLGNAGRGLLINFETTPDQVGALIGGTHAGEGNIISNNGSGIVDLGFFDVIQGNIIGSDITGTLDFGNHHLGVGFEGGAITLGGDQPGAGNLISGNGGNGLELNEEIDQNGIPQTSDLIQGNRIGVQSDGVSPLGNGGDGIHLFGGLIVIFPGIENPRAQYISGQNMIGGLNPGEGNVIAYNGGDGVDTEGSPVAIEILSNLIYANDSLGIDLGNDGVTPNDPGDSDAGINNLQNFPVLTTVATDGAHTSITGSFNSTPNTFFELQFFVDGNADASGHGQGQTLLGTRTVFTDSDGNASFNVTFNSGLSNGQFISATATNPATNATSEFSADLQVSIGAVTPNQPPTVDIGGPYIINEGDTLKLDASHSDDPDGDPLTYFWDLNGDGVFGDATGAKPTLTWAQLNALGIVNGPSSFSISLRVDDGQGHVVFSKPSTLTVLNVAPTVVIQIDPDDQVVNEETPVALSGSFTDPGTADTYTLAWSVVSTNGQVIANGSGNTFSFVPDDDGDYTVTFTVTDSDGGVGAASVDVFAVDVAPTPTLFGLLDHGTAGVPVILSASATDPSPIDTAAGFQFFWEVDSVSDDFFGQGPDFSFTPSVAGTYFISLYAVDKDGGGSGQPFFFHIPLVVVDTANPDTAPTVTLVPEVSINAGALYTSDGSFSDPDAGDSWTATVNYGDGSGNAPLTLYPDETFKLDHIYESAGSFNITVTVTDAAGAAGTASATEIVNKRPTALTMDSAIATYGGAVALSATLKSSGIGIEGKSLIFQIGGVTVGSAQTNAAGIAILSDVSLGLLDAGGATLSVTFAGDDQDDASAATNALTISKATLLVTANDQARVYGQNNPALNGSISGLQNGDIITATFLTTALNTSAVGAYPITATLNDPGNRLANYNITLTNGVLTVLAATLTAAGVNISGLEGSVFSGAVATFSTNNPIATLADFTATIDWGNGQIANGSIHAAPGGGFEVDGTITYADNSTYPVSIMIHDNAGGGSASPATQASVANVAPTVSLAAPVAVTFGTPFGLSGSFTDPGADTWTASVDYGQGAGPQPLSLTDKAFSLNNLYASAGVYTVTVTVRDKDGGIGVMSVQVTVLPPAPQFQSFTVNDGSAQRSMVNSLTVRFNQAVTLSAGALTLNLRGGGSVPFVLTPSADGRTFVLTFAGSGVIGGSLADGIYDLTIHSALVHDAFNQTLAGGDRTLTFYRLFGDVNGDGRVDGIDMSAVARALGSSRGSSSYLWYLDYDADGVINQIVDYAQIKARYGRNLLA